MGLDHYSLWQESEFRDRHNGPDVLHSHVWRWGTTRDDGSQQSMWVAPDDLPRSARHPFYERLNRVLSAAGFDAFVEDLCAKFYAAMGRPSLAPGRYFRLLLVGYFEGLDSERAIAWRAADSLSVRSFPLLSAPASPPDHSTISRTRRLFSVETHDAVFTWVLQQLSDAGLVQGKTLGIDATTLEANAAMRAIVRRDTGEDYNAFLTRLAKASGIETPTAEELARFDRKRKKKMSNEEWTHPHDPDSKIAKMKDGGTHMAHKVEHAVDLGTGAVVGLTLQGAEKGDTETVVEDGGYGGGAGGGGAAGGVGRCGRWLGTRATTATRRWWVWLRWVFGVTFRNRTGASAPGRTTRRRGTRCTGTGGGFGASGGRRLLRSRGELVERTFAHAYETGGMRRVHLRGHPNILEAPAGSRGGTQPRAASAPPDWGRHAPEPAGGGLFPSFAV